MIDKVYIDMQDTLPQPSGSARDFFMRWILPPLRDGQSVHLIAQRQLIIEYAEDVRMQDSLVDALWVLCGEATMDSGSPPTIRRDTLRLRTSGDFWALCLSAVFEERLFSPVRRARTSDLRKRICGRAAIWRRIER